MKTPRRAWLVLVLCGCAGALFHLDRHTLSVLKATFQIERGWTDADYARLVTIFMAVYTGCYLFTGRWIDRWGTRRTMPVFIALMSVATIGCGFSSSLKSMAALRALLALGQAGIMPAILVAIFRWFPAERRATAATIKEPIYIAGQILATPLIVWATQAWSWHSAFIIPGAGGLTIAVAWYWLDSGGDVHVAFCPPPGRSAPVAPGSRRLLTSPHLRRLILARILCDPMWFFYVYWEPGFLQDHLGFSLGSLGRLGWIPTAVATVAIFSLGALSDRWVSHRNWSPARSRRRILVTITFLAPAVFALPFVRNPVVCIILLSLARSMMVAWLSFSNLLAADLVPEGQTGSAVALVSAFGGAAGLAASLAVGPLIVRFGYAPIFIVGACLYPLAAFALTWKRKSRALEGPASILGYAYKKKAGKPQIA